MNTSQTGAASAAAPASASPAGSRPVPGDRWVRRAGRAVLRPFRPVDEVADAIALGTRLQRPTSTGRRIVVDDLGSGADAAVVTALVARSLAHFRHDRVLAVDATARGPALAERLGADGAGDLDGVDSASFDSVRDSLGEVTARLWTVRAAPDGAGAYMSGLLPISRFFGVTLVAGESGGSFVEAVGSGAHARVRVVRATRDAALRVGRELDALVRSGRQEEMERTVVVLFEERRREDPGLDVARTARVISESGAGVIVLPYDRHLAQGTSVYPRLIGEATHRTVQLVAAEALDRAVGGAGFGRARAEGGE
ncbi:MULTISPECIES: ATPase [Nocardiopsis]|uniref:ATPase n=1 Tax=Nocardiopsis sinuspersici TaxID=501010 RepID=A0A1V3C6R4_9ACTN|nr:MULTISPECIES: ATPase [Nocardiopsis]OOC56338.1 ATPase [Nocardiopsis sinuspersici]